MIISIPISLLQILLSLYNMTSSQHHVLWFPYFYNWLYPISAAHKCMGVGLLTREWGTCQWPHPQRRMNVLSPAIISSQWLLSKGGSLEVIALSLLKVWIGLILCCSCAGNDSCCEFKECDSHVMSRKISFPTTSPHPHFTFFLPPFWDAPWDLSCVGVGLEHSASYS